MILLKIADLESSTEMDNKALDAVVGGKMTADFTLAGGQQAGQTVSGGFGIFSPVIGVNTPVNMPIAIDVDTSSLLNIDAALSNVIGSTATQIAA